MQDHERSSNPEPPLTVMDTGTLNLLHVRSNFDRAAGRFAGADFVHRTAADGLLQRMQPISLQAKHVVDLGSALGAGSRLLSRHWPKARVLSVDLSAQMLMTARQSRRWFSRVRELRADAIQLPFATGSIDCVFANMLLPWINDLPACLGEISRVLGKGGVFSFSTLGPDSLSEIRNAWGAVDQEPHVHRFVDMHEIGDAVMRAGFSDPVLDVDYLAVTYRDTEALFADLAAAGARNSIRDRRHTLTGKSRVAGFREHLDDTATGGVIELSLELVYGHAFGREAQSSTGEVRVAPQDIGRRFS